MRPRFNITSERGSILPILGFILVAAIGIVGYLIDISRQELVGKDLQVAADAIALAAATEMTAETGSTGGDGWVLSKQAAASILQEQSFYDAGEWQFSGFNYAAGCKDGSGNDSPSGCVAMQKVDGDTNYSTVAQLRTPDDDFNGEGVIEVRFERGAFWQSNPNAAPDDPQDGAQFYSLETGRVIELAGKNVTASQYDIPASAIADAVKVTLTQRKRGSTLSRVLGMFGLGSVTRSAVAVTDHDAAPSGGGVCVAPFAIPACSLVLNTDPTLPWDEYKNHMNLLDYRPRLACERELIFTESDLETPERLQGLTRHDSYPRLPVVYNDPTTDADDDFNRRAVPIRGVLGLPESKQFSTSDHYETSPRELGDFFKQMGSPSADPTCPHGIRVNLGARFKPVSRLVKPWASPSPIVVPYNQPTPPLIPEPGFYDDHEVEAAIARFISTASANHPVETFKSQFGKLDMAAYKGNLDRPGEQPDFPYLKTKLEDPSYNSGMSPNKELLHWWPTTLANGTLGRGELLLGSMKPADWTSPMCHSKLMTKANNPDEAPVAVMPVMVIAPNPRARVQADYCDWSSVFNLSHQDSVRPDADTEPVVVGFVLTQIFDFNIMNLENKANHDGENAFTPKYEGLRGGTVEDINPKGMNKMPPPISPLDLQDDISSLPEDHIDEQARCIVACSTAAGCNPYATNDEDTDELEGCGLPPPITDAQQAAWANLCFRDTWSDLAKILPPDICQPGADYFHDDHPLSIMNFIREVIMKYSNNIAGWSIEKQEDKSFIVRNPAGDVVMDGSHTPPVPLDPAVLIAFLMASPDHNGNMTFCSQSVVYLLLNALTYKSAEGDVLKDLHCLPMKQNNIFNPFSPNEPWNDPLPLRAEYGCGGIRARVTCQNNLGGVRVRNFTAFATGTDTKNFKPSLVQ